MKFLIIAAAFVLSSLFFFFPSPTYTISQILDNGKIQNTAVYHRGAKQYYFATKRDRWTFKKDGKWQTVEGRIFIHNLP